MAFVRRANTCASIPSPSVLVRRSPRPLRAIAGPSVHYPAVHGNHQCPPRSGSLGRGIDSS
ncbi:MAG: hypothetical protein HC919_11410 [Oscillatoriales cyanobacterium SM2_2_1]|nr:hypothetical protein [Oscillatoriales cyanobacterium SM2_2_1]